MSAERNSAFRTADSTPTRSTALQTPSPSVQHAGDDRQAPLAARIERMRLHTRVAALERELVASERRRQAIIGQYELQLNEQHSGHTADESSDRGVFDVVRRLVSPHRW